ncbi:MAG: hypothetical protein ABI137_12010 [Antricoccus sp.]
MAAELSGSRALHLEHAEDPLDGPKWMPRHFGYIGDVGPKLLADRDRLRPFIRRFLAATHSHVIIEGPDAANP